MRVCARCFNKNIDVSISIILFLDCSKHQADVRLIKYTEDHGRRHVVKCVASCRAASLREHDVAIYSRCNMHPNASEICIDITRPTYRRREKMTLLGLYSAPTERHERTSAISVSPDSYEKHNSTFR